MNTDYHPNNTSSKGKTKHVHQQPQPVEMESLNRFLGHPYVVRNAIARMLYGSGKAADMVRLRSRAKGIHRYTTAEVNQLITIMQQLQNDIDTRTALIDSWQQGQPLPDPCIAPLLHEALNFKSILLDLQEETGTKSQVLYDRLRGRCRTQPTDLQALYRAFRTFGEFLGTQARQAQAEAQHYRQDAQCPSTPKAM